MKITGGSMATASAVLEIIKSEIALNGNLSDSNEHLVLEAFSNGREQGYCLKRYVKNNTLVTCFSRNRNSDDIVVYFGRGLDFEMQGNIPIDSAWDQRKYFPFDHYYGAAKFIMRKLEII